MACRDFRHHLRAHRMTDEHDGFVDARAQVRRDEIRRALHREGAHGLRCLAVAGHIDRDRARSPSQVFDEFGEDGATHADAVDHDVDRGPAPCDSATSVAPA